MPTLLTPPIEDATRREFLALLSAAGLLTGCATAEPPPAPAATRRVEHALGVAKVPIAPSRVLPLGANELEEVVALGFDPIGTTPDPQPQLPAEVFDKPVALTEGEPNLEVIAELAPDVIIGPTFNIEDAQRELEIIAPTIAIDRPTFREWKQLLRSTAEALGRPERADELLADYDTEIERVRTAIGPDRIADTTVTAAVGSQEGGGYVSVNSFANTVLSDLGFPVPQAQRDALPAGEERIEFSAEQLGLLDADVIFLGVYAGQESPLQSNPLWLRLPAVEAGDWTQVVGGPWNQGSVLAARYVLADIERFFTR